MTLSHRGNEADNRLALRGPWLLCVPNFSEGRDAAVISRLTQAVLSTAEVALLGVDSGQAAHRTVVSFAGPAEDVAEAAFRAIREASTLIDLRRHRGVHPRLGATDVCPLVPLANLDLAGAARYARRLGERVGRELEIPVFLYEAAASSPARRNLAVIRRGGYEGLAAKLERPEWRPDFGPAELRPRSGCCPGATVIGARDFLVAWNVNLDTRSVELATAIACDVREKGRRKRSEAEPGVPRDAPGEARWEPGALKGVKGIGWYIEEYGRAQVSLNLTDLGATSLHRAFEVVSRKAVARGARATGSELIGLVPLATLLAAGRHFLEKAGRRLEAPEEEILQSAVDGLGLDELAPFDPREKVLEYRLAEALRSSERSS